MRGSGQIRNCPKREGGKKDGNTVPVWVRRKKPSRKGWLLFRQMTYNYGNTNKKDSNDL